MPSCYENYVPETFHCLITWDQFIVYIPEHVAHLEVAFCFYCCLVKQNEVDSLVKT
jgi:hypothetical protein